MEGAGKMMLIRFVQMILLIMTNPPALEQKGTDWSKGMEENKETEAVTDIFPPCLIIERQQ